MRGKMVVVVFIDEFQHLSPGEAEFQNSPRFGEIQDNSYLRGIGNLVRDR